MVFFFILKGMGLTYSDSSSKKIFDCCAEKTLDKAKPTLQKILQSS